MKFGALWSQFELMQAMLAHVCNSLLQCRWARLSPIALMTLERVASHVAAEDVKLCGSLAHKTEAERVAASYDAAGES